MDTRGYEIVEQYILCKSKGNYKSCVLLWSKNKQYLNKALPWEASYHDGYGADNTEQQTHIGSKTYGKYVSTDPYALKRRRRKKTWLLSHFFRAANPS